MLSRFFSICAISIGFLLILASIGLSWYSYSFVEGIENYLYFGLFGALMGLAILRLGIKKYRGEHLPSAWVNENLKPGLDGSFGVESNTIHKPRHHQTTVPKPEDQ